MKSILGVSFPGDHDSNISIINDSGGILFCVNEERLTRKKKDGRFPKLSLEYKDKLYGNHQQDVFMLLPFDECGKRFHEANIELDIDEYYKRRMSFYNEISNSNPYYVSHHEAHAASAYYTSGFAESYIVTMDGGNYCEPWNTTIYFGKNEGIKPVVKSTVCMPKLYFFITALLGFTPGKHEGKITGLSAHGKFNQRLFEFFDKKFIDKENIASRVSKWVNMVSKEKTPYIRLDEELLKKYRRKFKNLPPQEIAYTVQYFTEKKVLEYIKEHIENIENSNIALAGGLFANVRINQKIKELGFKNVFVHPAMGDDGLSLGASLWFLGHENNLNPFKLKNVFFGPEYSNDEVREVLDNSGVKYRQIDNIEKKIAVLLAEGKVVARFRGRMEYGPRALGNRSILYQPTDPTVNDWLNQKLQRTEFMPFAPAVLEEEANRCFRDIKGAEYTAQFMTITFDCTDFMKRKCPGVVHVDNTARPQFVNQKSNPNFYEILTHYYKLTGIPCVINTSFNKHEEPIVCSPQDAVQSFIQTELDYLAIENFLVCNEK